MLGTTLNRKHLRKRTALIFTADVDENVTTFLAFTPLVLEPSIQAQFLVPFAASLGVGIVITTAMLMVVVPARTAVYLRVNASRGFAEAAG